MEPISKRAPSKKVDYYGTFLESVRQAPPEGQENEQTVETPADETAVMEALPDATAGDDAAAEPEAQDATVNPVEVLVVLRDSGPVEMAKLQSMTNLPFTRFAGVMAKLDEAGLVKISGSPGSETVEITSAGVTLASLG
jgi:hypothetical protein